MKVVIVFSLLLAGLIASTSSLAQDYEILIDPESPDSRDLITLTVTNSRCSSFSEVRVDERNMSISIVLDFGTDAIQECLANNPDAPDFSETIGPLAPGRYRATYFLHWWGRPLGIRATKVFSVSQAHLEALSEGGITGFYFNPDDDGHYVSVLETRYNTLVIWNTFDSHGEQAWIYGVGQLENGRIVVAESYINRSLGFSDGDLSGLQVTPWGTLEVRMDSCLEGTVFYETRLPEFGAGQYPAGGQFPIERLAYSKQLGCEEID